MRKGTITMRNKILAAVSVLALIGVIPALAQTSKSQDQIRAEQTTTGNIVEDAKTAWDNMTYGRTRTDAEIRATVISDRAEGRAALVTIDPRKTATGMIGHEIYNENGENVAEVTDIILDRNGKATMVVVSNASFFNMGRDAAFDYSAITRVESDGDVIMPLTEEIIDDAAAFSYNRTEANDAVRVIPSEGYSVSRLLKGRLLNDRRESVADVDNILFKNGQASQIIVGFDKTLGFGGEQAVLSYTDAAITRNGDALDFQLSANKSAQFEAYKNSQQQANY